MSRKQGFLPGLPVDAHDIAATAGVHCGQQAGRGRRRDGEGSHQGRKGCDGPLSLTPSASGNKRNGIISIIIIRVGIPYTFICLNGFTH